MADYQDIRGLRVKYLSADPSTSTLGEVWYNSTSGTLKATVLSTASWSSGGAMTESRTNQSSFGTQTAGTGATGLIMPVSGSMRSTTEEYNGASWGAGGSVPTPRAYSCGGGTQTAGLVMGGDSAPGAGVGSTEEYNGASYAAGGSLNAGPPGGYGYQSTGGGPQIAAMNIGGAVYPPPEGPKAMVQEYNGTAWTTSPVAYPQAVNQGEFAGTNTAALCFGGAPQLKLTNEWNGASFTTGGNLNTGRHKFGGCGTQTAALAIGNDGESTITELYDGTSWAATAALGSAQEDSGACGTTTAGLAAGGRVAPGTQTEEYNGAVAETQTLTTS